MRDHQQFECTSFENGITLYTYKDAFPISCFEIQLPVGSGHAVAENNLLPGSPHFLEHTQLIRSRMYPEPYALDRALGLRGGNSNGATYSKTTTHWIDTPADEQDFGMEALINRVFEPIFNESDIEVERSVVNNERNQNKFYPGKNKASQYYYTDFIDDGLYPLTQIFGSSDDLELLTADRLEEMHQRITRSSNIVALAVGNNDFKLLKEKLAALPTESINFTPHIKASKWNKKDYHLAYFESVAQPRLEVAWIYPHLNYKELRALSFVATFLINTTQGPLYQEFREEKGWTYGLDATCMLREHTTIFGLTFPVNTVAQVEFIRDCIVERIHTALKDQQLIEDEITRQTGSQVYYYQTAGSIISAASSDLINHGAIHTEAEWRTAVEALRDPHWRDYIATTFFKPDEMGCVCFLPDRRS